ncbi:MAG: hypothetical protein NC213_01580 [Acetobacter sp.]|nr:hypothetical protein [Bacteroides sp.]MCM1340418.1 hypothetical protein [Acetobacter sp.]MCM1432935.1 hypothetical protein [Clostridiales bacterium]
MNIIYWDFDGTLTYSNPLWSNSAYNALKEISPNNNVKVADIRKCMASGFIWHSPDNNYSSIYNNLLCNIKVIHHYQLSSYRKMILYIKNTLTYIKVFTNNY